MRSGLNLSLSLLAVCRPGQQQQDVWSSNDGVQVEKHPDLSQNRGKRQQSDYLSPANAVIIMQDAAGSDPSAFSPVSDSKKLL